MMGNRVWVFSLVLSLMVLDIPCTDQYQSYQNLLLLQLRKHLEFPTALDTWNTTRDLCSMPSTQTVSVVCDGDSVTELRIIGDKPVKVTDFEGYPVLGQTLSSDFSMDSFITTLTRLTSLRVVSLVSLGIWGSLSDKIHRLDSLQVMDFSSNFIYGAVPGRISDMKFIQTLAMDNNFFNSTLPDFFDVLTNLTLFSMKNNRLVASIPSSVLKVKSLSVLGLSGNQFSGEILDFSQLVNLNVLDLRGNKFKSKLLALPTSLVTVLLSKNSFYGEIPLQLSELVHVQHMDLSFNFLEGTPPSSIFSLPNITYLNLAMNLFDGSLPSSLQCGSTLGFVDISSNRLSGSLPPCLSSRNDNRVVVYNGNCLSDDAAHQHKISYCQGTYKQRNESRQSGFGLMLGVVFGIALLTVLLIVLISVQCRRHWKVITSKQGFMAKQDAAPDENHTTGLSSDLLKNASHVQSIKIGNQGGLVCRQFTVTELEEATNNFNRSYYLGRNTYGKLYKGKMENGSDIAVRCLLLNKRCAVRNLNLRIDLLTKLRHPHLVCLLGHCIDCAQDEYNVNRVFLVYEYIPNGNLQTHISEPDSEKTLKWAERLSTVIGTAKAIHFLHTGIIPGFFHNQLKSNNILIDENGVAKLSDYGLPIFVEEFEKGYSMSLGETGLRRHDLEDDVYSFGLILLEILVGSSMVQKEEPGLINLLASSFSSHEMVDPAVLTSSVQESLSTVISITNKCLSSDPSLRPSIEDVLWNLQYAAQLQQMTSSDIAADQKSLGDSSSSHT